MKRSTVLISTVALALFPSLVAGNGNSGFKAREFQGDYKSILQAYSEGDPIAAADALDERESAAVMVGGPQIVEQIRKAELKVAQEILHSGPEALLPVIALHESVYLAYRDQRRNVLIPHAREMVVDLIEIFAGKTDNDEGKVIASHLMTSMAGHLQEARVDSAAAALYRRALQLEGDNATALIGLSFLHEQYGEYSEAVHHLEVLVEIDPLSGAAQLRLGVNLARMGREESGTTYLRGVLDGRNPAWMRSVSYQELARMLTDSGDLSEARELLEEGVKVLPGDPSLLIQLAYLSERNGSFSEDPALTLALRHSAGQVQEPSPRFLYSQLPRLALTELRRTLAKQSDDNLRGLAEALGARSGAKRDREGSP